MIIQFSKKVFTHLLYFIKGLRFKRAVTEDEKNLFFKIRHDVYHEMGYIPKMKNGLFVDCHDEYSIHFLCYRWGKPVGCGRLILYCPERNFQIEDFFNIERPKVSREKFAEVSAVAIVSKFRGKNIFITMGLMKSIYNYVVEHDIEYLYFNTTERLAKYFGSFGLSYALLSEGELTEHNIHSREFSKAAFEKNVFRPYVIEVAKSKKLFKVI
ncbi:MAG: GNAT family N-acetyltransferase [Candidatus Pacebacteria bacterium]|nr:GNAT family N-acetyltransferase [Candidatus Paceibacterota bacterium]